MSRVWAASSRYRGRNSLVRAPPCSRESFPRFKEMCTHFHSKRRQVFALGFRASLTHRGHRLTLSAQMMNNSGPQLQKDTTGARARLPRKVSTACAHADERCDLGCALPINFERKSLSQYPRTPNAPQFCGDFGAFGLQAALLRLWLAVWWSKSHGPFPAPLTRPYVARYMSRATAFRWSASDLVIRGSWKGTSLQLC